MPTITLNKKIVQELIGKELTEEELKDRISMLGTDLEGIQEDEITVEIFPNRPDLLSEQGFSRALASFIGAKTGLREYAVQPSGNKVIVDASVTMRSKTACAIVKGVRFTDERIRELMQMQEKLATTHGRNRKKSCYGLYPLQTIEFPVTYKALAKEQILFKPLGFDKEMKGEEIETEHPTGKKYCGLAKNWKKYPCYLDNKNNILSMLPYTNSQDTGRVTTETTDVFIECTGTDFTNVTVALNMFVTTLADMGGKIYSVEMVFPEKTVVTPNLTPKETSIDPDYVNKRLGLELKEEQIKELLEKMGFGYTKGKVQIPAYRADILHAVDLIEDIAIAYGYENFKAVIPNVATIGEEAPLEQFLWKVRSLLVGLQLVEVKNYHLLTKEELTTNMQLDIPVISLQNALGEHNHLRHAVLPSILKTLSTNQHNEFPQNLFEIGRVFLPNTKWETGIEEAEHLAICLCHEKADFTQIKQVVMTLLTHLGLESSIQEEDCGSFMRGRSGKILIGDEEVGLIGELHPQVLTNWEIFTPTVGAEIDIEKVFKKIKN